ncbi:small acid-soluble spore protein Tlp [Peribacillus sp. SCS-155]|uniref:small acid-soluble spore protein Tlp n=1 Tax=Peribacillus sedimenti TaxID=3115297 RepID=UPI0039063FA4
MTNTTPKPDDRSDNVDKLQEMVQNTIQNIHKAEASLEFTSGDQVSQIQEKNNRRRESIETLRNEIRDEAEAKRNGY